MTEAQTLKAEIDPEIKRLLHNWYLQKKRRKEIKRDKYYNFPSYLHYESAKAIARDKEKAARKELFEEMERQVWRP